MSDRDGQLKKEIIGKLMSAAGKLPTSTAGRMGRTALAGLRAGRLVMKLRKAAGDPEGPRLDAETAARIVAGIGQLKGIGMKVGQIMSYIDVDLPPELMEALSVLQTHAQPMAASEVRSILAFELGDRGREIARTLEETPIAAASIGQVHAALLPDGSRVAVKVQYPGIEKAIEADFGPTAIGSAMGNLLVPDARVDGFIREARARFLEECDYVREARMGKRFAEIFAGHPVITVPPVHEEYCSRRVLTTTFVDGKSYERFMAEGPPQGLRDSLGAAMFDFYVGTLFRHCLYNGDPHPGNYLFLEGGRIAMLDHGCTREFERAFVAKLGRLTEAVQRDDGRLLHGSFVELGMVREGKDYDYETARALMRRFYGPMIEDRVTAIDLGAGANMRDMVLRKREMMKLSLPGEFLFLFRIRLGLMAVLSRMGARANWFRSEREAMAGQR